jgi:hypothetical protein
MEGYKYVVEFQVQIVRQHREREKQILSIVLGMPHERRQKFMGVHT